MGIRKRNNFLNLKGKIIVIAGATGLIGKELCKSFLKQDSTVIICSRNSIKGKEFEKKLNKINQGKAIYCQLDIAKEKSIEHLIKFTLQKFNRIDVFINCSWPRTKDWMVNVEEVKFNSIKKNITDHLGGYFLCAQRMAQVMKKQKQGVIINFSSIYGIVGPNFSIYKNTKMTCPPAYPLIKGGIIAMTKYFAIYFAKYNIRVNCISPGGVFNKHDQIFVKQYSRFVPLGRMGNTEDLEGIVLLLASERSSYITGQCIVVDGGWTAW